MPGLPDMTHPNDVHPLAPHPGTDEEGPGPTDNSNSAVKLRGGVELGAMRYVLVAGMILGIVALTLGLLALV